MNRARKLYRRLLRLYPAEFRGEFSSQMERDFADEYVDARGRSERRKFVLRAFIDVLATAPGELVRGLKQDLRHALRLHRRTPLPSVMALLMLAVGIASVSAFLALYLNLAVKPYSGFEKGSRVVTIAAVDGVFTQSIEYGLIQRIEEEVNVLDAIASVVYLGPLSEGHDGETIHPELVSRGFFEGIRPKLSLGRGFDAGAHAPDAEPVAVISDSYWRDHFSRSSDAIGQGISIVPQSRTGEEREYVEARIVGVMSPDVSGIGDSAVNVWLPWENVRRSLFGDESDLEEARLPYHLGRLRSGASAKGLAREIESRYSEVYQDYAVPAGYRIDVASGVVRNFNVDLDAKHQLRLFLIGGLMLALVASINLSLFLLSRGPARRREMAIRTAVGASSKRLAQQLALESGLLVSIAAIPGLTASIWLSDLFKGMDFLRAVEWADFASINWQLLSLVVGVLAMLTVLVSLAPIIGLKSSGLASSIRLNAARATRLQEIAGTSQVLVATVLGSVALAFLWHFAAMAFGDPGYERANRYQVTLTPPRFLPIPAVEVERIVNTVESLPGVTSMSASIPAPAAGETLSQISVLDPQDPSREIQVDYAVIDSKFVDVLGIDLIRGRVPTQSDIGASLVNEALARRLFGLDNSVGESIGLIGNFQGTDTPTQIVGVLEDVSFTHPRANVEPMLFRNVTPNQPAFMGIVVSILSARELQEQLGSLRDSGELDFRGAGRIVPLEELRKNLMAPDRARTILTSSIAGLVLLLATFGFYGIQRHLVNAGLREYAIRASLGAGPRALRRLVFMRGLQHSWPGLLIGAPIAFILIAWLRGNYLASDVSPSIVAIATVVLIMVLLQMACLGPARRVRQSDPASLLRED